MEMQNAKGGDLMYWLIFFIGVALLLMALITLVTKGAAPTGRVAPQQRMLLVPFLVLAGLGCLLESVPHLLGTPTSTVVAAVVGALLLLAGSATMVLYRLR